MSTRDFRRPMFRAARRASNGRNPTTAATRTTPIMIAHADASGRAILPAPRLLDHLAVPHAQGPMGPPPYGGVEGHEDERLTLLAALVDVMCHVVSLGLRGR